METWAWRVHLLRESPGRGLLVGGCLLAVVGWSYHETNEPWVAAIAGVFLFVSVSEYLLPRRYRLDADGVLVRGLVGEQTSPWHRLRRVEIRGRQVMLSPFRRPGIRDAIRGLRLYAPASGQPDAATIVRYCEERLEHARKANS